MEFPLFDTDLNFFTVGNREYVLDIPTSTLFEIHPKLKKIFVQSVGNLSKDYLNAIKREFNFLDWMDLTSEINYLIDNRYITIHSSKIVPYELKEQKINSLTLNICHDCNMHCIYCYQNNGILKKTPEYMTNEVAAKSVELLFKDSPDQKLFLNISGGEPLLNTDLVNYIIKLGRDYENKYDKKLIITITTNGTLLNKKILDFFKSMNVELIITLDGRPNDHNLMRVMRNGRPSYDLIFDRLQWVQEREIKFKIKGVIHHFNVPYLENMIELYTKAEFPTIILNPVIAPENARYALTLEDLEILKKCYEKLFEDYTENKGMSENIYNITESLNILKRKKNAGYACGAGKNYVCIDPNGDIYPCHLLVGCKEFYLGNVMHGLKQKKREEFYQPLHVLNRESCSKCWAKYMCGGGCIAENYLLYKNLKRPNKARCEMTRYLLEKAIYAYCSILSEEESLNLATKKGGNDLAIYKIG